MGQTFKKGSFNVNVITDKTHLWVSKMTVEKKRQKESTFVTTLVYQQLVHPQLDHYVNYCTSFENTFHHNYELGYRWKVSWIVYQCKNIVCVKFKILLIMSRKMLGPWLSQKGTSGIRYTGMGGIGTKRERIRHQADWWSGWRTRKG